MKYLALAVCGLLFAMAQPARAEADARTFLQKIDAGDRLYLHVLDGYANGFGWANAELNSRGQPPLFCQPEKLAITAEQNADILRRFVKQQPAAAEWPAGLALLSAYQETFPCEGRASP